jgi:hypothetical protein
VRRGGNPAGELAFVKGTLSPIRSLIVPTVGPTGVKPKPPSAVASRGLTPGRPTEAWLGIGFRDEWGLTVFPKSGTGRRRVQQMWMSSDPPLSSLTEVRIEHRLSL